MGVSVHRPTTAVARRVRRVVTFIVVSLMRKSPGRRVLISRKRESAAKRDRSGYWLGNRGTVTYRRRASMIPLRSHGCMDRARPLI